MKYSDGARDEIKERVRVQRILDEINGDRKRLGSRSRLFIFAAFVFWAVAIVLIVTK